MIATYWQSLLNDYNPDAIFDIHRDGASRKTYVTKDGNNERCMVRIVVGQANPNKEKNLEFAKYLMGISEVVCPWLFLDIYYAKGHYNQQLYNKSLLFEMGSHLVEKSLVEKTVPYLADVVVTALYNTTVESENNLTIGNTTNDDSSLNEYFDENLENEQNLFENEQPINDYNNFETIENKPQNNIVLKLFVICVITSIFTLFVVKNYKKKNCKILQ